MNVKLISYTKGVNGESPEKIIELAARTSYKSFGKMDENSHIPLIKHLIKQGHTSVLEHAVATIEITGISRACSHQLVRHRLASFTQESQRYVNLSKGNNKFVIPLSIIDLKDNEEDYKDGITPYDQYVAIMDSLFNIYEQWIKLGIPKEDARFILPNAATTSLMMTANFREWVHIIDLRVSKPAQWEIRELMIKVWKLLYEIAPTVFGIETFSGQFKREIFETFILSTNVNN